MSLRGDKYETEEEVKMRLENSIVLYDNEPVYITRVTPARPGENGEGKDPARVYFKTLPHMLVRADREPEGKEVRKYLSSKKFDLTPMKLGYFNRSSDHTAYHASRVPVRQYKQGLTQATLGVRNTQWNAKIPIPFLELANCAGFVGMLKGQKVELADASERLKKGAPSVALSSDFALERHPLGLSFLRYQGKEVAFQSPHDKHLCLSPAFAFLRETLEEARIPFVNV